MIWWWIWIEKIIFWITNIDLKMNIDFIDINIIQSWDSLRKTHNDRNIMNKRLIMNNNKDRMKQRNKHIQNKILPCIINTT